MNGLEEGTEVLLQFEKRGHLLPVVVQNGASGTVLMVGYTNAEALARTRETGFAHFYSTSRQRLWKKGESSGDFLRVDEIRVDCDQDALLYLVTPVGGGVCHTRGDDGNHRPTCFYRRLDAQGLTKLL
ncbi:MAG: phosphoribosyl-AMP cyclohydrolase [Alkalispirochaetaceae bacterium]